MFFGQVLLRREQITLPGFDLRFGLFLIELRKVADLHTPFCLSKQLPGHFEELLLVFDFFVREDQVVVSQLHRGHRMHQLPAQRHLGDFQVLFVDENFLPVGIDPKIFQQRLPQRNAGRGEVLIGVANSSRRKIVQPGRVRTEVGPGVEKV